MRRICSACTHVAGAVISYALVPHSQDNEDIAERTVQCAACISGIRTMRCTFVASPKASTSVGSTDRSLLTQVRWHWITVVMMW
jgi:hypothetical protein